jgi:hypothetical protein
LTLSFRKSVKPIGTTFVLTALIWMYAEQINSENITETITLQVAAPSGADFNVKLQDPANGQLQVTFTGTRERFERLRRDMESGKFQPIYYIQAEDTNGDIYVKETVDIVNSLLVKKYSGVSAQSAKPAQVRVAVDHLISETMPVRVLTGTTKTTPPVVVPDKVKVLLSKSIYQKLSQGDRVLVVDIGNELRGKAEDKAIDMEFPLPQTIMGQPVVTDPTRVRIQLAIQQQFLTHNFDLPRIQVLGPTDLLTKYRVDIRNPQITVALRGPVDVIKNLRAQDIEAYLELEAEDMFKSYTTYWARQVKFVLPDEITLDLEKMSRPPEVDFKLIEQQSAAPIAPR